MPTPENGGKRFEVHCSTAVAERLKELQRVASNTGRGKAVAAAFRHIIQRLELGPEDFGEPAYRLPFLRMQIRSGIVAPLVVDFAVCEDRPIVFIKGVQLLS